MTRSARRRAGFIGKIASFLIDKRLLNHSGAGRFSVGAGDKNGSYALRESAENIWADFQRHSAGKRCAASSQQANQSTG